ncbi:alcohol dehydrogenase [Achromobacter sp. DMS1]|uniref:cytochrome c n=1 Tax=Achromobacter sp. DMS1 TaxID=1688405 RepID=UPI00069F0CB6|nr:cytochrome c [Achromobacter sp. DMS1]KOF55330.1 alcohol dehydrogenase [Achromobacter sp. DMS1]KOF55365.1 alcohol dehydrogenase [Achromobacter sp. DMS1]
MKKFGIKAVAALAVLAAGAVGGAHVLTSARKTDAAGVDLADRSLAEAGAYIARTGDCVACHSAPGGKPFAGGLAMQTPVGTIYSSNITPDKTAGIGSYAYADFKNAVQYGIRKDGTPLYPAMPYPSYAIMPDEDVRALYAYFMTRVQPEAQPSAGSTIPWPLNMRWPMAWWQALFAPKRGFAAPSGADEQVARGAYLVEGPGHCGACHTPRGLAYQEKALSLADGDAFLSGAVIDGWRAKSLRGEAQGLQSWSEGEIGMFLKTGRTDKVAAFGAMADVVEHSTRHFTDGDIAAVAAYLKQLPPAQGKLPAFPPKQDATTAMLREGRYDSRGAVIYMEQCVACHRADGQGMPRIFPALAGNSAVYAQNAQSIIQITLEGGRMPSSGQDAMAFAMPGFRRLSDRDIADVINFIRTAWTNQAPAVAESDVAHIRAFLAGKQPNIVAGGAQ